MSKPKKKDRCSSQSTISNSGRFVEEYTIKTKEAENENASTTPPEEYQIVKKQLNLF